MSNHPTPLSPAQLDAYFAFTEVGSLLRPAVEKQLKDTGALSYVQFQLLARLGDSKEGVLRMTDLADGLVYSRSGLTYQAQLLEQRGLITRYASPEDERSTVVAITPAARSVLDDVFPGHIQVVRELLFVTLSEADVTELARILGTVRDQLRTSPPRSTAPRARRMPQSRRP